MKMKLYTTFIIILSFLFFSCDIGFGPAEAAYDNFNYESITNETGTVMVKLGDQMLTYENALIVYSESDTSTLVIKSKEGKYIYIQGPAVVELDSLKTNHQ